MAGLVDYFDSIARVVGGTAPDPTNRPRWFSGDETGDSTGVTGLKGCYSGPQRTYEDLPVGVVLSTRQRLVSPITDTLTQGFEHRVNDFQVVILASTVDPETEFQANLAAMPDAMYSAFAAHVGLFSTSNEYQAHVAEDRGPILPYTLFGIQYYAWEFTIRVMRAFVGRTYTV